MRNTGQNLSSFCPKIVQPLGLALILAAGLLLACGKEPESRLDAALGDKNRQIDDLTAQNAELALKVSQLQQTVIDLQADLDNLTVKEAELRAWARQLADSYGPGVWFISGDERPLPRKAMAHATVGTLIRELNYFLARADLPTVTLTRVDKDTVYLRISDEKKLTQTMGTTGATAYIEAVTYTLTSLKNIHYVEFDFKEGDHAIPGRYSR